MPSKRSPDHHDDTALDAAADASPQHSRPFGTVRTVLRIACAAMVVAALSVFARETIRSHPPLHPGEGALSVIFKPSASPSEAPTTDRAGGGKLKLEEPATSTTLQSKPAAPFSEDTLVQGSFDAIESPHLLVTLSQGGDDAVPSLFVTLVRRAADGPGLSVIRTGERRRIETKFGAMETIEATLVGDTSRVCTGFASQEPRPVRIDGWLCAPLGQPPEPQALACTIDRLALDGSADAATEAVFKLAAARRDPRCLPAAGPLTASRNADIQTGSIEPRRRLKK